MDSVTQFALGAAVGVAVLGSERPLWKGLVIGGAVATLPDLDVFIDHGDAVVNMVQHRAHTHSFIWHAAAAPFIAAAIARIDNSMALFFRWWLLVLLCLLTHAGLDAMTVYGTRLLLPQSDQVFAVGSIFIIDPLYTLPLILGLTIAGFVKSESRRRWNTVGLIVSSVYLAWSFGAQQYVLAKVQESVAGKGMPASQILVTPTPFNTVLWRVVIMHKDRYDEGFYSLLDPITVPGQKLRFNSYPRGQALIKQSRKVLAVAQVRQFSSGFYAMREVGNFTRITDLRMGLHPNFIFSFQVARRASQGLVSIKPTRIEPRQDLSLNRIATRLWARLIGQSE